MGIEELVLARLIELEIVDIEILVQGIVRIAVDRKDLEDIDADRMGY